MGIDDKQCKNDKFEAPVEFRTSPATVLSQLTHLTVLRKEFAQVDQKRSARKIRRRRGRKETVVSPETFERLKRLI